MSDVLPTCTTAGSRRAYPIVAGVSDDFPTHKPSYCAQHSHGPGPTCSSIGPAGCRLRGRLRVNGGDPTVAGSVQLHPGKLTVRRLNQSFAQCCHQQTLAAHPMISSDCDVEPLGDEPSKRMQDRKRPRRSTTDHVLSHESINMVFRGRQECGPQPLPPFRLHCIHWYARYNFPSGRKVLPHDCGD
jgi:hypothetical protein